MILIILICEIVTSNGYINEKNYWHIHINTDNQKFVDQYNRIKIFHGINVVNKNPYDFTYNHNEISIEDLIKIRNFGYNIIRLGVFLDGIMPNNRTINQQYLQYLKNIAQMAGQLGIYVLLDMHQDIMGGIYCGSGFPAWIFANESYFHNFPYPLKLRPYLKYENGSLINEQCADWPWEAYYFSEASSKSFEDLLSNRPPLYLRDILIDAWIAVIKVFKDVPNVIGYDLLNEPFPGNIYYNPLLLIPEYGNNRIMDFYNIIFEEIRKYDDTRIFFYEPVTWASNAGFRYYPGGEEYANRTVLNIHFYSPPLTNMKSFFSKMHEEVKLKKIGIILSEFFVTNDDESINTTMDTADEHHLSYMGWEYLVDVGNETKWMKYSWTRIYPMTIAGDLDSFNYNRITKDFWLLYNVKQTILLNETMISYASHHFLIVNVYIKSLCQVTWKLVDDLFIKVTHDKCSNGESIYINIKSRMK